MLSRSQIQLVQSLKQKKFRQKYGLFCAGGDKVVRELLQSSFELHQLYALGEWLQENNTMLRGREALCTPVSPSELKRLSFQDQPDSVLALVRPGEERDLLPTEGWCLALDRIRDPGNLGTLLRIADWFGLAGIYASPDCADRFNPKVVQASMGSVFRVPYCSANWPEVLRKDGRPIYGADAKGERISTLNTGQSGILLIGSESQGLAPELEELLSAKLAIVGRGGAESLNASVAAGILLARLLNCV